MGYKNFYKKYRSQKFCKENEKKIKIKILKFDEPFLCKKKEVLNDKKLCKGKISYKRYLYKKFIVEEKKIPSSIMRQEISSLLKKDSIIKKTNKNFPHKFNYFFIF